MPESRLANMILLHWQTHLPSMATEMERTGRLTQAVKEAEARAGDLLYEYLSVRKMQYREAWELAMRECLLPEETPSSSMPSQSKSPLVTSG
jgi:hypothetical protein